MTETTGHATIYAALSAFQGEIADPAKTKWNPHFKSFYADVQAGLEIARPLLAKHGLAVLQITAIEGDMVVVRTRLAHASGEWIEGTYPVAAVGLAQQQMMGNLTYARRAGLFGMLGIAPDDADGEGTTTAGPAPRGGGSAQQQRATARSLEKAASAPMPSAPAGDVPHDPETGEVENMLLPSESEAVKDEMISKLQKMSANASRHSLQVWARANGPLKNRLQPEHKVEVELVFKALKAAVQAAVQTGQEPREAAE